MTFRSPATAGRLLLALSLLLTTGATARADGLFTPFWGWDFGGDAGDCRSLTPCDPKQTTFGASLAFMVGGIGVVHTDISASSVGLYNAFTNNAFAFDAGGGLMVFFSDHVGVRGDLRYVRTFDKIQFAPLQLNNAALQFGRGTIGLTLRF